MAATFVGGRVYLGEIPLAIRPWRGLQAAASRLVSMPGACDHWLADDWELERIPAYIESNPVRVGSVDRARTPIVQRRKSVEASLDAADTSVRATNARPHSAPQTVLAESQGYPLDPNLIRVYPRFIRVHQRPCFL